MVRVRTTGGVIVVDNDMWRREASRAQRRLVIMDVVEVMAWPVIKMEITMGYKDPEDNGQGNVAKRTVTGVNRCGDTDEIRGPVTARDSDGQLVYLVSASCSE